MAFGRFVNERCCRNFFGITKAFQQFTHSGLRLALRSGTSLLDVFSDLTDELIPP
jgi:hypothetical protein